MNTPDLDRAPSARGVEAASVEPIPRAPEAATPEGGIAMQHVYMRLELVQAIARAKAARQEHEAAGLHLDAILFKLYYKVGFTVAELTQFVAAGGDPIEKKVAAEIEVCHRIQRHRHKIVLESLEGL